MSKVRCGDQLTKVRAGVLKSAGTAWANTENLLHIPCVTPHKMATKHIEFAFQPLVNSSKLDWNHLINLQTQDRFVPRFFPFSLAIVPGKPGETPQSMVRRFCERSKVWSDGQSTKAWACGSTKLGHEKGCHGRTAPFKKTRGHSWAMWAWRCPNWVMSDCQKNPWTV